MYCWDVCCGYFGGFPYSDLFISEHYELCSAALHLYHWVLDWHLVTRWWGVQKRHVQISQSGPLNIGQQAWVWHSYTEIHCIWWGGVWYGRDAALVNLSIKWGGILSQRSWLNFKENSEPRAASTAHFLVECERLAGPRSRLLHQRWEKEASTWGEGAPWLNQDRERIGLSQGAIAL